MAKRERVEDLGILYEKLRNMAEHPAFTHFTCRAKDAEEWFDTLTQEAREELIHTLAYNLQNLKEQVFDCMYIAQGEDL